MLTAEVNHFNCQISLAESLDILCSIQGCCGADLGALLWRSGCAYGRGVELIIQEAPVHKKFGSPNLWRRSRPWCHFPNVWIQNCQDRHGGTTKLKAPSAYWKALYVYNLVDPLNFIGLLKIHCLCFSVLWSHISPPTVEHKYCCSSLTEWPHPPWKVTSTRLVLERNWAWLWEMFVKYWTSAFGDVGHPIGEIAGMGRCG